MELNEELVALVTQKVLETLRAGEAAPAGSQAAGLRMTVRDGEEAKPASPRTRWSSVWPRPSPSPR